MKKQEVIWWEQFCLKAADCVAAALHERETEFERYRAGESRRELAGYLYKCAERLGYTPHPSEIIGGKTLLKKFGSWDAAIEAAGLEPIWPGLEPPPVMFTALYRRELKRQWRLFKTACTEEENRQRTARAKAASREKAIQNKLKRELNTRQRQKQEWEFAAAHAEDSDQQLYEYLKDEKRRRGKKMSPVNTVGVQYLVQRLGPWRLVMGQINAELREERLKDTGVDEGQARQPSESPADWEVGDEGGKQ